MNPTITMRAFAPKGTRLTVQAETAKEAKARLVQICRDCGLPIRRTMATARIIKSPYYPRYRKPRTEPEAKRRSFLLGKLSPKYRAQAMRALGKAGAS